MGLNGEVGIMIAGDLGFHGDVRFGQAYRTLIHKLSDNRASHLMYKRLTLFHDAPGGTVKAILQDYEPRLPCDATQVGRFRSAIGEAGVEELLKAAIDTAVRTRAIRPAELEPTTIPGIVLREVRRKLSTARPPSASTLDRLGIIGDRPRFPAIRRGRGSGLAFQHVSSSL
jgi:hypothetical protein